MTAIRRSAHIQRNWVLQTHGQLEEFAELWKAELDLPFAVYGVIPNYVKEDKFGTPLLGGDEPDPDGYPVRQRAHSRVLQAFLAA